VGGGAHAVVANHYRRLKVRYERQSGVHQAFLELGCALICWNYM
jgi:hypothetical protein